MTPTAIIILELTLKYGPAFVQQLIQVIHKENPTLDEWNAAFDLAKNPIVQVGDVPAFKLEDLLKHNLDLVSPVPRPEVLTIAPENNT